MLLVKNKQLESYVAQAVFNKWELFLRRFGYIHLRGCPIPDCNEGQ
jgi:hypothetical protein